jgi:hypothetical protein
MSKYIITALEKKRARLLRSVYRRNTPIVFDALAALGVTRVIVTFDARRGYFDLPGFAAFAGDEPVSLPKTWIAFYFVCTIRAPRIREDVDYVAGAVCQLCEDHVAINSAPGWDQGPGCCGQLTLDVRNRVIHRDYFKDRVLPFQVGITTLRPDSVLLQETLAALDRH